MNDELALEFSRVTEAAALAAFPWIGRGDKNAADDAAVNAMRQTLNQLPINGTIVIGEGEIDQAPMLYIGEAVGQGHGEKIDIAVDPIDGTRMTAAGQANALTVLAVAPAGTLLNAPDMYMEKLVVGPIAKGAIDLSRPLIDNLKHLATALDKPLSTLTLSILDKPRHHELIRQLIPLGIRVFTFPDGDVAASLLTSLVSSDVDLLYGIGGAPEGVITAAAIRALGGDMQARLLTRDQVKSDTPENRRIGEQEIERCREMSIDPGQILTLDQLARSDKTLFVATGITAGDLVKGIRQQNSQRITETLIISGISRTVRRIETLHFAPKA